MKRRPTTTAPPTRTYSPVERHLHDDPVFKAESLDVRYAWLYLLTTRRRPRSLEGVVVATFVEVALDLAYEPPTAEGLPQGLDRVRGAFDRLDEMGWAHADWDAGLILLPPVVRERHPANNNVVRGWRKQLDTMPGSPLKERWLRVAYAVCEDRGPQYVEAFVDSFGEPPGDEVLRADEDGV